MRDVRANEGAERNGTIHAEDAGRRAPGESPAWRRKPRPREPSCVPSRFSAPAAIVGSQSNATQEFEIEREEDRNGNYWFTVTGTKPERWVVQTNFDNDEAVGYLADRLAKLGVEDALRKNGARPGDEVRIGRGARAVAFDWDPTIAAGAENLDGTQLGSRGVRTHLRDEVREREVELLEPFVRRGGNDVHRQIELFELRLDELGELLRLGHIEPTTRSPRSCRIWAWCRPATCAIRSPTCRA